MLNHSLLLCNRCAIVLVAILVVTGTLAGCSGKGQASGPIGGFAMPVQTQPAQPKNVDDSSEYVATIKSRYSVVLQPQVEGQITHIFVKSGNHVKAGAPILQIDPLKQTATVSSQEATRKSREANLEWARTQLERSKQLYSSGVASKQELDQAQTAFNTAQADAASLDAQVREQQVQLKYFSVVAPIDGIIGDIPVHVGDRVTTSTVLTTVDQKTALEAYISVPADRVPQLKLGTPVQIVDGTGKVIAKTRVTFISPQVDPATQAVLVKATVASARTDLREDQFVRARVIWSTKPQLAVPVTAVSRISGQYFAYVAEQDAKGWAAHQRPIRVGQIIGSDYVVLEGIKPGDQVIVSGTQNLADGVPVAISK